MSDITSNLDALSEKIALTSASLKRTKGVKRGESAALQLYTPLQEKDDYKSYAIASSRTSSRDVSIDPVTGVEVTTNLNSELSNVAKGLSPWEEGNGAIGITDAVVLCQKAYWNVSIFKQTIDVQTEFCNSKIVLKGENKAAIEFYKKWFKKIGIWDLANQFFREYFRSSNVMMWRVDAKESDLKSIKRDRVGVSNKSFKIPLRYIILNPAHIRVSDGSYIMDTIYYKVLTPFEVQKLASKKKSPKEQEFFDALDPEIQKQINDIGSGGYTVNKVGKDIKIPLDNDKLYTIFAKKQDYEPMAIPMYFPVLYDIDLKLKLKQAESVVARAADYLILLINVGGPEVEGDINQALMDHVNRLFQTDSVGRVFVADWSTNMQFVVPDLNKILGPQKYEVVNADIADGLMNIFFKEEKFSNSSIKIKVFIERLNDARQSFLENFLKPEMERIGKNLGFKNIPKPDFTDIDLKDEVEYWKIYNRLAELGLLTGPELFEAHQDGILPTPEDSLINQKQWKKYREDGLYEPIIGAKKTSGAENGGGREPGTEVKDQNKKPVGASSLYSMEKLKDLIIKANSFISQVENLFKKTHSIKRMSKTKKEAAFNIAKTAIVNEPPEKWTKDTALEYLKNPLGNCEMNDGVYEIAAKHGISDLSAALMFYSEGVNIDEEEES